MLRRRPPQWFGAALVLLAVACSAGCQASDTAVAPSTSAAPDTESTAATTLVSTTTTSPPASPLTVDFTVDLAGDEFVGSATVGDAANTDPFDSFVACSGHTELIGGYQLLVSQPDDSVSKVRLSTDEMVAPNGFVAAASAAVTVDDESFEAIGDLTLADDLRSGRFEGVTEGGDPLMVDFECTGTEFSPALAAEGSGALEIAALFRRADEERVVTYVAPVVGDDEFCGVDGVAYSSDVDRLVTGFVAGADGLELSLTGTDIEWADVEVVVIDATAGTFSGTTTDGTRVDGGYRCR